MDLTSLLSILVIAVSSFVSADEPNNGFVASASYAANANAVPYAQQPADYPSAEANSIEGDNSLEPYEEEPSGFGVQTGYEGYLVPEEETGAMSLLTTVFPQMSRITDMAYSLLGRSSTMLMGAAGAVLMGGLATTAVCVLTPLCTLSFVGLARENVRDSMRSYLTPEKIDAAASFIKEAYEKYQKLNRRVRRRSANKKK